jgi:ubiquinone/menaquinone biosynthesis C-methylase UbiE
MFSKSAAFYDAIYGYKDYAAEAQMAHEIIQHHLRSNGARLLDVGCGTGAHIRHLKRRYSAEGLDLDPALLAIARQRNPEVTFHEADMTGFELSDRFDVIVCLFGAIGYVKTLIRLREALACIQRHLKPGGVLLVEPWFTPDSFVSGRLNALYVDEADLKIARMNISSRKGNISVLDFHYMVGTPQGIETFSERHELGLFSHEEYMIALYGSGFDGLHDPQGLNGRGLYIATRSLEGASS